MIAILLGAGFEEMEALCPYDMLRRGGVDVRLVSLEGREVTGGQGVTVVVDMTLADLDGDQVECVVLPGGLRGVASLEGCPQALALVKAVYEAGKLVAAICAAPRIFHSLGLLHNRQFTAYPSVGETLPQEGYRPDYHVVVDGNVITAKAAGSSQTFGKVLLALMTQSDKATTVMDQIYATAEPVLWHKEADHAG